MDQTAAERKIRFEHGLLLATFALLGIGLVMVYSATVYLTATPDMVTKTQGNGMFYLERQFIFVMVGIVALATATFIPFDWYKRVAGLSLVVGIVLMVGVLFVGQERLGAVRWYDFLGVSVQPGEYVKLAFVLWVSYSLARKREKVTEFSLGVAPHLAVAGVLVCLYMLQPDLGSSIILGSVMMILLYVAGIQKRHIALLALGGVLFVGLMIASSAEKRRRVVSWLNPEAYAQDDAFQLINSKVSIGSGGLFGKGLGSGKQNIAGYVPEAETDFIFSVLAEEGGFLGSVIVVLCFGFILWKGMALAISIRDHFARYLTFGVTLLVVLQAGINLGVNCGILPTKGLTLPLISMGGSSMVVMCTCVGIILNVSRTHPRLKKIKPGDRMGMTNVEVYVKENG